MVTLPEKVRKALDKTVKSLRTRENVYGIGLFGSWSRGEAAPSSDADLLILSKSTADYEYVERTEVGGLFIDLDYVPRQFFRRAIPPELDQKLFEMQILYDRDWSLADTRLLMARTYGSPERVEIRTEAHIVDSDIYLSRSTSAFAREDLRSAMLFAIVGLESILKVLIEIAMEPYSNSHSVERLEKSTKKLGMDDLFTQYSEISRLGQTGEPEIKGKLRLFKAIWDEVNAVSTQNPQTVESAHFKVRTSLDYYLNQAFLQGAVLRTTSLISSNSGAEAWHYLKGIGLSLIENYVWLKSLIENVRMDYATMMRSLESLEARNRRNYLQIAQFLDIDNVDRADAANVIQKTRQIALEIRRQRKVLIKKRLGGDLSRT